MSLKIDNITILEKIEKGLLYDSNLDKTLYTNIYKYRVTSDIFFTIIEKKEDIFLNLQFDNKISLGELEDIKFLFSNIRTKITEEEATKLIALIIGENSK